MLKSSMEQSTESRLTIYFDEPFWVGVFEELDGKRLSVCRVVFGSEPTDAEIYAFILRYFNHLRFSPPVKTEIKHKADNPKRRQRNAHKQLEKSGVSTKSQQALQKQYEENKLERKQHNRRQKEAEKQRLFELCLWQTMKPETPVEKAILENHIGMFAICAESENGFDYWIAGLYQGGEVPNGLELYAFPESSWAVFSAKGPMPKALQTLNTYVWQEWFPNEGQKVQANGMATLEVYSECDPQSPDCACGIWVPVKGTDQSNQRG